MKRMPWHLVGPLAWVGMSLVACAANGGRGGLFGDFTPYPPPGFAHESASDLVELFWNCTRPQPETLLLDGLAFSTWTAQDIRDLEFSLVGVDARGTTVAEASGAPQSLVLETMRSTPFQLSLRLTGSEARFDLFYQYWDSGGPSGNSSGSEPRSKLHGGGPPVQLVSSGPILLAQVANTSIMVHDVCSDTQHRAR